MSEPGPVHDEEASLRLPAEPDSVAAARGLVREVATAHDVSDDVRDALLLSVSEAATNVVEHAYLDQAPGSFRVAVALAPGEVVVRVIDEGRGMRPRTDSPGLGLGLPTIGRLSDALDVQAGPGGAGTEVRMTFTAPGVGSPAGPDGPVRRAVLAEVARIAQDRTWPNDDVGRLTAAIVPAVADACALDLVDADGVPRRVAGRITGPRAEADSHRLGTLRPRVETPVSATRTALEEQRPRVVELTLERIRGVTYRAEDAEWMAGTGIRWWVVVPMVLEGKVLGLLHFGARDPRPQFTDEEVDFFGHLARRAASGLGDSALLAELRRTRERLERVLVAIDAAIYVQDANDAVLFANPRVATLLGHDSTREVLGAPASALLSRHEVVGEDGRPLAPGDLPAHRVLAGEDEAALDVYLRDPRTGSERRLAVSARPIREEGLVVTTIR